VGTLLQDPVTFRIAPNGWPLNVAKVCAIEPLQIWLEKLATTHDELPEAYQINFRANWICLDGVVVESIAPALET
jgi:hypothetical protein